MRRLLKTSFKTLAYGAFFVVALAFFVYRTLPLDQVQAYLVRKAADEHNLDLEITELHTAGVAGLEMSGVMLRARPSAEEREALSRARERRRQWEAGQAEKKKADGEGAAEGATAEGDDEGAAKVAASKPAKGAKGKPDAAPESAADAKGAEAVEGTESADGTAAKGKGAKGKLADAKGAKGKADAEDQPPPLPTGPQPMFIDRVAVKVNPLKLIMGDLSASLELEALGGQATADLAKDAQGVRINAQWAGMSLTQVPALRSKVGLPFAGDLGGKVALTVPPATDGAGLDMANVTGEVELLVTEGQLGPAKTVPQGSALHDALSAAMFVGMPADQIPAEIESDLPRIRFTRFGGLIGFEGGKATLKDFLIEGPDVVGDIVGHFVLASQFTKWAPRLHQRFKFTDEFLAVKENQTLQAILQGSPKVRLATDPEGYVGIQYTGFITQPKPSFTKYNSVRPRPRPGAGGAADARGKLGANSGAAAARVTKGRMPAKRNGRLPGAGRSLTGAAKLGTNRAEPLPPPEPTEALPAIDPSVAAPGEPIIDVPEPVEMPEPTDAPEEEPAANPDDTTGEGAGGDETQPGDGDGNDNGE